MSHFYGAPAMALMPVGAGAMLVGSRLIGMPAAVGVDAALWTAGTLLGLWTAVAVPFEAFTSHDTRLDSAFGGWLMPIVPRWSARRREPCSSRTCRPDSRG
jgi:tellurite resistance protein TehA-like permease